MSSLRDEIIESEKVRSELLKWKLLIVSALGAAGLGFTKHEGAGGAYLVLLLIPLVCFYVDLLCKHISLRIMVIGTFIRIDSCEGQGANETAYERFVEKTTSMGEKKYNVFALEEWVLRWSTIILSGLVALAGLILPDIKQLEGKISLMWGEVTMSCVIRAMFIGSGVIGGVLTLALHKLYQCRLEELNKLAQSESKRRVEELSKKCEDSTPRTTPKSEH